MNNEQILNKIIAFFPWGFAKASILLLIAIYFVFALVVVRQEKLMSKVVEIPFVPIIRILTYIHLVLTIVVFLLGLVLL